MNKSVKGFVLLSIGLSLVVSFQNCGSTPSQTTQSSVTVDGSTELSAASLENTAPSGFVFSDTPSPLAPEVLLSDVYPWLKSYKVFRGQANGPALLIYEPQWVQLAVYEYYYIFLLRKADDAGAAHWMNLLNTRQATFADVRAAIRNSPEAEAVFTKVITTAYRRFLKREPDAIGLAHHLNLLKADANMLDLITALSVSEEAKIAAAKP